ncbi:Crp/Fnr family transcriptional regulator [Elioraea rosea]|uniref:Crp/Fnr family transcriptional regulator n=1 Tax=Elioraea rosea TaxID=2492390 RepID=UPI001182F990|nr:Crp/Fnr family transcriptional regulator [Elioraea rosea]
MAEDQALLRTRTIPYLDGVDERGLGLLLAGSHTTHVPKGTALLTEGAAPAPVHLVLEGRVALTASGEGGHSTVITLLGEGDVVAVPSNLLGLPSPVGAVATMPSRVLTLDPAAVRTALAADASLARLMLTLLSRQWCALIGQMKDLKLHDSRTRVARWLAESARGTQGTAIKLAAPKAMLARNLGMTPESFSRALAALEAAGAISAAGSSIAILDRRLLEGAQASRSG